MSSVKQNEVLQPCYGFIGGGRDVVGSDGSKRVSRLLTPQPLVVLPIEGFECLDYGGYCNSQSIVSQLQMLEPSSSCTGGGSTGSDAGAGDSATTRQYPVVAFTATPTRVFRHPFWATLSDLCLVVDHPDLISSSTHARKARDQFLEHNCPRRDSYAQYFPSQAETSHPTSGMYHASQVNILSIRSPACVTDSRRSATSSLPLSTPMHSQPTGSGGMHASSSDTTSHLTPRDPSNPWQPLPEGPGDQPDATPTPARNALMTGQQDHFNGSPPRRAPAPLNQLVADGRADYQ